MMTGTACGCWSHTAPWPGLPPDIHYAALRFTPDRLLASEDAGRIDLPGALYTARPRRRADYIAGRLCALAAIRQAGGGGAQPGRRPDGAPDWPAGLCGSISHAEGQAVAAVGHGRRYRSIGVDVEHILAPTQADALAPMILTPDERARLGTCPPPLVTTLAFSLKEALFKLLHPLTGTMFFHEQAALSALLPDGRATLRLLDTLSPQWPAGTSLPARWHRSGGFVFSFLHC